MRDFDCHVLVLIRMEYQGTGWYRYVMALKDDASCEHRMVIVYCNLSM